MKKPKISLTEMLLILICVISLSISGKELFITGLVFIITLFYFLHPVQRDLNKRTRTILIISLSALIIIKCLIFRQIMEGFIPFIFVAGYFFTAVIIVYLYKSPEPNDNNIIYQMTLAVMMISGNTTDLRFYLPLSIIYFFLSVIYFIPVKHGIKRINSLKFYLKLLPFFIASILIAVFFILFFKYIEPRTNDLLNFFTRTNVDLTTNLNISGLSNIESVYNSKKVVLRLISEKNPVYIKAKYYSKYSSGQWSNDSATFTIDPKINNTGNFTENRYYYSFFGKKFEYQNLDIFRIIKEPYDNRLFFTIFNTDFLFTDENRLSADDTGNLYSEQQGNYHDYIIISPKNNLKRDIYMPGRKKSIFETLSISDYTTLPPFISVEFKNLSEKITQGAVNDYERSNILMNYFHENYKYSHGFKPSKNTDPLEDFVLNKRAAHCEYFATAMAVMLRTLKIPSRYVIGFIVHERNSNSGYYIVREKDAHAWVEAYIKDKGWVQFDPTPPSAITQQNETNDYFDSLTLYGKLIFNYFKTGNYKKAFISLYQLISSGFIYIIILIFIVILILSVNYCKKKKLQNSLKNKNNIINTNHLTEKDRLLISLMNKLEKDLARKGYVKKPAISWIEFADTMNDTTIHNDLISIVNRYYLLRFSSTQLKDEDISDFKRIIQIYYTT